MDLVDRLSRWPSATVFLAGMAILLYLALSKGTFYIPNSDLGGLAFFIGNPVAIVSHMFVHVGVLHLVGNLVPLVAFALLLELSVPSFHVVGIFLFSGALSAIVFSLLNPETALVGASAAIAGLMGALTALKPKQSIALLLILPFLVSYVALPWAMSTQHKEEVRIVQAAQVLQQNVTQLVVENRTEEAVKVNETLKEVQQQVQITQTGKERERITPTDFLVHAYGAAFGVVYLFLFRKKQLTDAVAGYARLGGLLDRLTARKAAPRRKRRR